MTEPQTDIFVTLKDVPNFDWSRVVIPEPITNSFTKAGTTQLIEWTNSQPYYKGDNGEKLLMFFEGLEQNGYLNGDWGEVPENERNADNLEGYQVCLNLTSKDTMNKPTADEKAMKTVFDKCHAKTLEAMGKFCNAEPPKLEGAAFGLYLAAQQKKKPSSAVKPLYDYKQITNKADKTKTPDTSEPQRGYYKLSCKKTKKNGLVCDSRIYGPGDKLVSPTKYLSTAERTMQILIKPVYFWQSIFWGAHGKYPYGASMKFIISEMNATPVIFSAIPQKRMLPPNKSTAIVVKNEDGSNSGEGSDGNSSFTSPLGGTTVNTGFKTANQQKDEDLLSANLVTDEEPPLPTSTSNDVDDDDVLVDDDDDIPIVESPKVKAAKTVTKPKVVAPSTVEKKTSVAKKTPTSKKAVK